MSPEDHVGPIRSYRTMVAALHRGHPYRARIWSTLHYYDGPIVAVVKVKGDHRPRLDVMIDQDHEGDEATRVFTHVHHHLVFDRLETLEATLHEGVPTHQSYRLAEYILRYRTRMTRIGHPEPSHEIWTSRHTADTIPEGERPDDWKPVGLPVPGYDPITKDERR